MLLKFERFECRNCSILRHWGKFGPKIARPRLFNAAAEAGMNIDS